MRYLEVALASVAVALLCAGSASAQMGVGPSFSLDDNPAMPITSPPGIIPGLGAEDPFGIGTYGLMGLAPSPTLPAVPAMDAEILRPLAAGIPVVDVAMSVGYAQPFGYVDAVSRDSDKSLNTGFLHLAFSVDRISMGGIAASAVSTEAMFNQQPGDIYRTSRQFHHPVNFVGIPTMPGYNGPLPVVSMAGSNFLVVDESLLALTAGNLPGTLVPPGVLCPPIMPGTHDNADAVEFQVFDLDGDINTDSWLFFSTAPDEMGIAGTLPADIYAIPPNTPANMFTPYAQGPAHIGLIDPDMDNIDALVVWEDPDATLRPGVVDPAADYALFSLSHGSTSLNQWGLTESDIFFTDFTGGFWLFARDVELGLMGAPGMMPGDNVDALETLYPGDANLDDCVDGLDYVTWSNSYGPGTLGNGWLQADFTGDGITDGLDYVVWSNNYQMGCPVVPTAVPEPASALVLTLGLLFIRRRSRA